MLDKKKLELLVGKREPVLLEMVTSPFKTFCSLINKSFLASLNECFFFLKYKISELGIEISDNSKRAVGGYKTKE